MALLLGPTGRHPVGELLHRFLVYGVPHAFPAVVGPEAVGVPTAYAAPVFAGVVEGAEGNVWPHPDGTAVGPALTPLFARAAELARRNPALYELLTIVDALRVGQMRAKKVAEELLRERLVRPGG